jgi:tRNA pseudouridine38-40 synthase
MRTLKLILAYDGTNYVGWQRQANGPSVQQALEDAIAPLAPVADRGPGVAGASRTDAGVHALAQVASVNLESDLPVSNIWRALNVRLPFDIRVVSVEDARLGFHARFHARGKTYRYRLVRTPVLLPFDRAWVWHTPELVDVDAMRQAAGHLVGRHDFASFQARGSATIDTVRSIERLAVYDAAREVVIDVAGNGFLRHMVRAIVGTLVEVGSGLRPASDLPRILAAKNRQVAGPTAPARGLMLIAVRY